MEVTTPVVTPSPAVNGPEDDLEVALKGGEAGRRVRTCHASRMNVEHALGLLAQCAYRFWDDQGTDEIGALLAEARASYDAAEHTDVATVAIGRSLIAAFELRLCIDVENELNSGWDYDLEGPPLNGVEEDDWDDVSRPVAERAAEAARAAMDADPEDPLVPIHLGHALAWLGDRDGAVAAYREALRRDPRRCVPGFR